MRVKDLAEPEADHSKLRGFRLGLFAQISLVHPIDWPQDRPLSTKN